MPREERPQVPGWPTKRSLRKDRRGGHGPTRDGPTLPVARQFRALSPQEASCGLGDTQGALLPGPPSPQTGPWLSALHFLFLLPQRRPHAQHAGGPATDSSVGWTVPSPVVWVGGDPPHPASIRELRGQQSPAPREPSAEPGQAPPPLLCSRWLGDAGPQHGGPSIQAGQGDGKDGGRGGSFLTPRGQ